MSDRKTVSASLDADDQYNELEASIAKALSAGPLFRTDADPDALWAAYLNEIQEDRRQHYNCHCCRRFIQRIGGLVTIDENGHQRSALWSFHPPAFFRRSVDALHSLVKGAKVTGVFLSGDKTLGIQRTKDWTHLSCSNPTPYTGKVLTVGQAMAEKLEDYKMLCHGLADYSRDTVEQAVRVLKADAVYRSEKALGVADWLLKLHESIRDNTKEKRNVTWLAVANAPPGFCHVRSTMIGTLLEDITSGLDFDSISRRWKDKMHPLQYQRPTAAPKGGTIKQAEELVAKLGVERSLLRRYARLDDILAKLWVPRELPSKAAGGGVFDHLRNQPKAKALELPAVNITWEKFAREILGDVLQMEIMAPSNGNYCGLVTATDPDAPAIIQWDGLEGHPRNPVSLYVYHNGSAASNWGLTAGWVKVTAVFRGPHKWQEPSKFKHQADSVCFAIDGCRDSRPAELCLFPEILKAEFHGIRAVVEAHSKSGGITGREDGNANGLIMNSGSPVTIRVRTATGLANYTIDRLD